MSWKADHLAALDDSGHAAGVLWMLGRCWRPKDKHRSNCTATQNECMALAICFAAHNDCETLGPGLDGQHVDLGDYIPNDGRSRSDSLTQCISMTVLVVFLHLMHQRALQGSAELVTLVPYNDFNKLSYPEDPLSGICMRPPCKQ